MDDNERGNPTRINNRSMVTDKKGWSMTFMEFNKHFEFNMAKYPTYVGAYEAVEELHEKESGERKYSSYNSFQTRRKRIFKK
jgi:hypothetical protein